ncbi:MAG: hypothetical protein H7Y86_13180 [Rhizobacter sp.]|nr:hypothetical protein [Ferruginibacter sp.]
MLKKNTTKLMLLAALIVTVGTSCKKEEVLAPADPATDTSKTVIFIRAVDKDSSVVESQQLLLR